MTNWSVLWRRKPVILILTNCFILTPDRAVNQRCTCVNKRKIIWFNRKWALWNNIGRCPQQLSHLVGSDGKSKSQVAVSRSAPLRAAVSSCAASSWESWRQWRPESKTACSHWERSRWDLGLIPGLRLSNPGREAEEVLSESCR